MEGLWVPWPWHSLCPRPHHAPLTHRGTFIQSTMLTDCGRGGGGWGGVAGGRWVTKASGGVTELRGGTGKSVYVCVLVTRRVPLSVSVLLWSPGLHVAS